ncbi:hypothetical protein ACFY4C_34170 [Actinomadura viridis]|uniref:hypothetical protein n=1 Tax=Actinomadura viridis TaxID=58110 RepID=UPI0036A7431A
MRSFTARPPARLLPVLGLLVLSPMCAEYLVGYDTSTGDPLALLGGLLLLAPLYGAPAVLIREAARRSGMRWPGVVALALAFAVLQAGVVDQSMFSESYRDIEFWDDMVRPTFVPSLGIAAYTTLSFLTGHVIWSYGAPIALVESLAPRLAGRPWLRGPGLVLMALLYLASAALILVDHLRTQSDHATPAQLTGALVAVAALAAFAVTAGRRRPARTDAAVPPAPALAAAALAAGLGFQFLPATWPGVAGGAAILAVSAAALVRLTRSVRRRATHTAALAAGVLVANAIVGFLAQPLGEVSPVAKYAHNTAFFAGAVLLGLWAARRAARDRVPVPDRR